MQINTHPLAIKHGIWKSSINRCFSREILCMCFVCFILFVHYQRVCSSIYLSIYSFTSFYLSLIYLFLPIYIYLALIYLSILSIYLFYLSLSIYLSIYLSLICVGFLDTPTYQPRQPHLPWSLLPRWPLVWWRSICTRASTTKRFFATCISTKNRIHR